MWGLEWSFLGLWLESTIIVAVTGWLCFRVRRLHRGRKVALRRLNGA